jgi:hypothetical protein
VQTRRGRATVISSRIQLWNIRKAEKPVPSFTNSSSTDYRGAQPQETFIMTATVFNPSAEAEPVPIPAGELLPWVVFGGLLLLLAIYFVGAEQGATSLISGMYVHEFVHDGRHLLGFPCH